MIIWVFYLLFPSRLTGGAVKYYHFPFALTYSTPAPFINLWVHDGPSPDAMLPFNYLVFFSASENVITSTCMQYSKNL
jgi:hypothetical protein